MKHFLLFLVVLFTILGSIVYIRIPKYKEIESVGFIFPDSIHDQTWGTEGYKAVLDIVQKYDANFYIQENIDSDALTRQTLDEFVRRDVSIIYGQGSHYEKLFNEYAVKYPKIHFVFTNGKSHHKNVTALNIEAYSMGFFAGYLASRESKTHQIGVIGAFNYQPEIKGFMDGAYYENKNTVIQAAYVKTWAYHSDAIFIAQKMIDNQVDVFYPAADGINSEVMQIVKSYNKKAIGYISDQSYLGDFVIASTVQDISRLYQEIAKEYTEGRLVGGTKYYGMKENIAYLQGYSPLVSKETKDKMEELMQEYHSTNRLPNGKATPKNDKNAYLESKQQD
ncbi:BMP family ABC transporter substrate-binding protein [Macrococcoides caseolyticum]|uniref:BMP family ABC transporter substrate-binding protein n=1 Tax=Macrococcoides caseolyticum TaxID=69966 RepID=UPI001F302DB4|nr:BMP family ABC transporter substrate-binding protein [Macrococcus caseolyticus]MCE4955742.1 BMP family ABC transporter substrate-binding protein [Macrococcus caseolyticus]